ncbi:MAG TPA: hypothetical protein VNJ46_05185, partial [Gaiellaceae bacterium]|nr:hypothetical protein [Gaiellaceae bacterium]
MTAGAAVEAAGQARGRQAAVWAALVVAGVLVLLSAFAVWLNRVALDTEVFADTSAELIEDEAIRRAVAARAVDELFASVDVQAEIERQLPSSLESLSGPAAAGLREASYRLVERALGQPRLQRLWALAVEQAHRALVRVLEEREGGTLGSDEGVVTLDLGRIVLEAAERVGLRSQVADTLPPEAGRVVLFRSDELDTAQDAARVLGAAAAVLPILALLAFAAALAAAGDRRRAVRGAGLTLVAAGIVGLVAASMLGARLVDELTAESETREAAAHAWSIATEPLRSSLRWLAALGVLVV